MDTEFKRLKKTFSFMSFFMCLFFSLGKPAYAEIIPDIYDDFSDGKYQERTGVDPWGRPLPSWNVEGGTVDASSGYIVPTSLSQSIATISVPTDIVKGTWVFKYKYLNADAGLDTYCPSSPSYCLGIIAKYLNSSSTDLRLNNPIDGHWWVDYIGAGGSRFPHSGYIINMVGSQINPSLVGGGNEHEVVFIKDDKGYVYTWLDGKFVRWSTDLADEITSSTKFLLDFEDLGSAPLTYPIAVDEVKIYKDKYLPPVNAVVYDAANQVIKITGWGTTLSDIATAVNDPTIFLYNASTHTGTAYKDILVDRGSKFQLSGETLLMNSASDGERKIKYYTDVIFDIENSTVDSTNSHYFLFQRLTDSGDSALKNTLRVINSTINNFAGIYLDRPVAIDIENSHFTNMAEITPFQVYFRWPARELTIKNSVFSGKAGTENVDFIGGDQFSDLSPEPVGMDIVDCDFSNVVLRRSSDANTYHSYTWTEGTVNLINTKTNILGFAAYSNPAFPSAIIRKKYYLDVKVVDQNGNPVNGANVTVANETDNTNHPVENLSMGKGNFGLANQKTFSTGAAYFDGQTGNWIKSWDDVNNISNVTTSADGYTPLPSDITHTLVVTANQSTNTGSTSFTYRITAEKNGRVVILSGVNPDPSWRRDSPDSHQNTVTLVLDTGDYPETWYNASFAYRKQITINHAQVSRTDQTDFPVLVTLNDPSLKTVANGGKVSNINGYDIAFTSQNGTTKLDHEIESYDGTNGTVIAWIRIPILSAINDTVIYVYYGNPNTVTPEQNKTGVWNDGGDNHFKIVQHMNQNPAGASPQMLDSTQYANNGSAAGMVSEDSVAGIVGNALSFDGGSDYVSAGAGTNLDFTGQITMDAWVKTSPGSTQYSMILGRTVSNASGWDFRVVSAAPNTTTTTVAFRVNGNGGSNPFTLTLNNGTWYHLVTTYNGSQILVYQNGSLVNTRAYTGAIVPPTGQSFTLGKESCSWARSAGVLDEVRISDVARSEDWIKTEYNNETDPGAFVSLSSTEEGYMHHLVINGATSQIAGSSQTVTITARNMFGNKVISYSGNKTIVFSGAGTGSYLPTFTDKDGHEVNFGSSGVVNFVNGTAAANIKLYKIETAEIDATDGIYSTNGDTSFDLNVNVYGGSGGSGGGSSSEGSGGGSTSLTPVIVKTEIKSLVGNLLTLNLNVTNASQMMLSDTSSFLGSTWINYTTSPTYTKQLTQTKLYLKFKSATGIISSTVELIIPPVITNPGTGGDTHNPYPTGTLLKLSTSPKVYVIIDTKKKWIPTPEVFEQLGYKWTEIKILTQTELNTIPDYEDNLIRQLGDYKVYLVVNGVKRHIPNPIIFLDYGFKWEEVKDVPQSTIDKYKPTYLIKQSGSNGIYYVNPQEIRKLIPSTEVFNSYNDKTEDIQIISKTEMDFYPLSNLIKLNGSNDVYLIEGNIKKRIPNPQVFNKYKLNWNLVMSVNQAEFNFYSDGGELK